MKHIKEVFGAINNLNSSCLGHDTDEGKSAGWNQGKYGKTLKRTEIKAG